MAESAAPDTDEVTEFERDRGLTVEQRIHAVMADVPGKIEYDKSVKGRDGKLMYEYVSHDAVTNHIRSAMIKHRLIAYPTVVKAENNGNRIEETVEIRFCNIDAQEDTLTIQVVGFGVDPSDKGPGKALSYAVKAAMLKVFMLNSADDIEEHDISHDHVETRVSDVREIEDRARQDLLAWAHSFKAGIEGAKSIAGLDALVKQNKATMNDVPDATARYFNDMIAERKAELEDGHE